MKFLAVVGLIVFLALLLSLNDPNCAGPRRHSISSVGDVAESMVFFRHRGSGLCFAYSQPDKDGRFGLLANVPCEAVRDQLIDY